MERAATQPAIKILLTENSFQAERSSTHRKGGGSLRERWQRLGRHFRLDGY
jgi:hypothetical protein